MFINKIYHLQQKKEKQIQDTIFMHIQFWNIYFFHLMNDTNIDS